jgi:hypothetical protein
MSDPHQSSKYPFRGLTEKTQPWFKVNFFKKKVTMDVWHLGLPRLFLNNTNEPGYNSAHQSGRGAATSCEYHAF